MPSLIRRINILSRCSSLYRKQQYATEDELIAAHHSYILAICRSPGMSQEKIARLLCFNKSNVTRNLTILENKGFIERKRSVEDKRELLVYPTQKMLDAYPTIQKIADDWNAFLAEGIPEEELEAFNATLKKMIDKALIIREK